MDEEIIETDDERGFTLSDLFRSAERIYMQERAPEGYSYDPRLTAYRPVQPLFQLPQGAGGLLIGAAGVVALFWLTSRVLKGVI